MKGGMIYFGLVTVLVLAVMVIAMTVSGGFEMIYQQAGWVGVAGFVLVFVVVSIVFMVMVRRALKRAMDQGTPGDAMDAHD